MALLWKVLLVVVVVSCTVDSQEKNRRMGDEFEGVDYEEEADYDSMDVYGMPIITNEKIAKDRMIMDILHREAVRVRKEIEKLDEIREGIARERVATDENYENILKEKKVVTEKEKQLRGIMEYLKSLQPPKATGVDVFAFVSINIEQHVYMCVCDILLLIDRDYGCSGDHVDPLDRHSRRAAVAHAGFKAESKGSEKITAYLCAARGRG